MRYSKQREAVYGVLSATDVHPDVGYVYREVRKVMPTISLGTVYRNLEELVRSGRAKKLGIEGSVERFDGNVTPHSHFVCNRCGKIFDVPMHCDLTDDCMCGEVERAEVIFYGICNECKK